MNLLFLDRDGVINKSPGPAGYITAPEQFEFLPKSLEAIRLLTDGAFDIRIVSNQGCLSKGLLTRAALDEITRSMIEQIKSSGGRIGGVYYCPHQASDGCACKKPKLGLFNQALRDLGMPPEALYMVGDSSEDIQAGSALGAKTILVLSGRTRGSDYKNFPVAPDTVCHDLWDAARWILQKKS